MYQPGTGYTALYSCFNNWLQCTDRVPATQPCRVASTTGYSIQTGYRLHNLVHLLQQLVTECTNQLNSFVQLLQQLVTVYRPGTGYTLQTGHTAHYIACFTLTGPTQRSSTSWPHQQPIHRPKTDDRPDKV